MKNFDFKKEKIPFTQVSNEILNNSELTCRAKGLYAYLFSKPNNWDFSYLRISKDHKESKNTILKTLHELEKSGYLKRTKLKSGKSVYYLSIKPMTKDWSEPVTKIAYDQKVQLADFGHLSNKDSISNTDKESNKESTPSQIAESFFEKRKEYDNLLKIFPTHEKELSKFIDYWTEPNKSGTKVRWQLQQTFDVKRRLNTWLSRAKLFNNSRERKVDKI